MGIVTIDGPSGVGKSAVARALAQQLQYRYLGVGLVYRAFAWAALHGVQPGEQLLGDLVLHSDKAGSDPRVLYHGRDISDQLYGNVELEQRCAILAQEAPLRHLAKQLVAQYAQGGDLVLEGRASNRPIQASTVKFFLWADPAERERRNRHEYERIGRAQEANALVAAAQQRDTSDLRRRHDPLRLEQDMIAWDSTFATMDETVAGMVRMVQHHHQQRALRLSVIIPVRNRAAQLVACLRSLQQQTLERQQVEIIVVDDGSSEDIAACVQPYAVELLRIAPSGPAAARNRGIAQSSGDVLILLDADMVVQPDFLAQHLHLHERANNLVVLGARRHLPPGVAQPDHPNPRRDSREAILDSVSYNMACLRYPWSIAYTCNLSFPRTLLPADGFDESFAGWGLEDLEFAYRLSLRGARWAFSRRAAGYHQFHDRSMTPERFAGWQANLQRFQHKHPHPAVMQLDLLAAAFDPQVQADFLACYAQFNAEALPQHPATVVQAGSSPHPLTALQDYVYWGEGDAQDLFVIDDEAHADYEIMLAAAFPRQAVRFYTPADWNRIADTVRTHYAAQGLAMQEIALAYARSDPANYVVTP